LAKAHRSFPRSGEGNERPPKVQMQEKVRREGELGRTGGCRIVREDVEEELEEA
jgi:hypothetical protein